MNSTHRARGFTLLELLVALAIFAVMSVMAYGGLRSVLTTRDHTDQAAERLAALQQSFLFMQQDLSQAVLRGVRDELGGSEPAFSSGSDENLLRLTRGGVVSFGNDYPASLQRVEYRLEDARLLRVSWPVLDRTQSTEPLTMELLSGVVDVYLRFLADDWREIWSSSREMPRAVEIVLVLENEREVRRIFLLAS